MGGIRETEHLAGRAVQRLPTPVGSVSGTEQKVASDVAMSVGASSSLNVSNAASIGTSYAGFTDVFAESSEPVPAIVVAAAVAPAATKTALNGPLTLRYPLAPFASAEAEEEDRQFRLALGADADDDAPENSSPANTKQRQAQRREGILTFSSSLKRLKPLSQSRLRWTLLWLAVVLGTCTLPLLLFGFYRGGLLRASTLFYVVVAFLSFFCLVWFFANLWVLYYVARLRRGARTNFKKRYSKRSALRHIVVLCVYRDPMSVVCGTVSSLAKQTEAKRIKLVIAWEARTPDVEERTAQLHARFAPCFDALLFTQHPLGEHEIATKSSNANWGLRQAIHHVFATQPAAKLDMFVVSTADSDSLFHPRHFEALSADYLGLLSTGQRSTAMNAIWQAPLFYNWQLDQSSFVTRITGLLRATMTMGCIIPYSVNPMSCFSFSLALAIRGNSWHPQIIMDDVGFLETMMIGSQAKISIRSLPVPVVSGPTSGATWLADIREWYVQVRRWAIGTADNFHYLCVKLSSLPVLGALSFTFGYFLYYGVLLCAATLFGLSTLALQLAMADSEYQADPALDWLFALRVGGVAVTPSVVYLLLGLLVPYFNYGCMFLLDGVWTRAVLRIREDVSLPRNVLHWILMLPALIMLSLTQLWGYIVISAQGKSACVHKVAGKATLNQGVSANAAKAQPAAQTAAATATAAAAAPSEPKADLAQPLLEEKERDSLKHTTVIDIRPSLNARYHSS